MVHHIVYLKALHLFRIKSKPERKRHAHTHTHTYSPTTSGLVTKHENLFSNDTYILALAASKCFCKRLPTDFLHLFWYTLWATLLQFAPAVLHKTAPDLFSRIWIHFPHSFNVIFVKGSPQFIIIHKVCTFVAET